MAYQDAIDTINTFIVENHNNEITAEVLNPVLQAIVDACAVTTGDPLDLVTADKTNLVAAINELANFVAELTTSGVQLYRGTDNPNITPPSSFNIADFYIQVDVDNNPVQLYQYNGFEWVVYTGSDGEFVPLAGTLPLVPVTGPVVFDSGAGSTNTIEDTGNVIEDDDDLSVHNSRGFETQDKATDLAAGVSTSDGHYFKDLDLNTTVSIKGDNVTGDVEFQLPAKPEGSYTLATIELADNFADDTAAATGGIPIGGLYHTSGTVKIRLT